MPPPKKSRYPPSARCPKCNWFLKFGPYSIIYKGNNLNLWEGFCANPYCDFGHVSINNFRVIGPNEAIYGENLWMED
jgi:hypothetical protein